MADISMRVGVGYDVHGFAEPSAARALILGGVTIPYERGLAVHSDADVLIHALVDALLGATALGDIGVHFPSSDPHWKDTPSLDFLTYTLGLLNEHGWRVANVDATVVAEQPKLTPHVPAMRDSLAQAMGLEIDRISVKAKTTDRLGFTGRGEGIACHAVALVERTAMEQG